MTTETKNEIRDRINEVTGSQFEAVHPEYFLTPSVGELFCAHHHEMEKKFVLFTVGFCYSTKKQVRYFLPAQKFVLN